MEATQTKRTLALTHNQIETVLFALAIASSNYMNLHKEACKLANKNPYSSKELRKQLEHLLDTAGAFDDLHDGIENGELDV